MGLVTPMRSALVEVGSWNKWGNNHTWTRGTWTGEEGAIFQVFRKTGGVKQFSYPIL